MSDKKFIMLPCNQEYKDMVRNKAKEQGFTVATYLRIAVTEKIRKDIKELNS